MPDVRFVPRAPSSSPANPEFLGRVGTIRSSAPSAPARALHSRPHVRPAMGGLAYATRAVTRGKQSVVWSVPISSTPTTANCSMPSCCTFVGVVRVGRWESERRLSRPHHFDVRFPPPDSGVVPFSGSSLSPTRRAAWRCENSLVVDLPPSGLRAQSTPRGNGRDTGTTVPTGLAVTRRPTADEPPGSGQRQVPGGSGRSFRSLPHRLIGTTCSTG
jgi:hypothetical protein